MPKSKPKSNIEWEHWGKTDPLFGVASWPGKQRGSTAPWTDDEFYKLGETDWKVFSTVWKSYGFDPTSCLEIGCGAGRLTMQLANSFHQVLAVDVSREMIAYAEQNITSPNVAFNVVDGIHLPAEDSSVSAVFSTHVFQHFSSIDYATQYFQEIARVLRPNGTMMIHMPVYIWHPRTPAALRFLFQLSEQWYGFKIWANRILINLGINRSLMQMIHFPVTYIQKTLLQLGFTDVEIRIPLTGDGDALQPFVMARKPE